MATLSQSALSRPLSILLLALVLSVLVAPPALAADRVTTYQDENGWKLKVNGEDFYVKGVVWGYSPRGANYTFNLWGQDEEFIRKVLDHDFGLLAAANVNAVRTFSMMPPQWITYVYEKFGIMSIVNPLFGRYGAVIDGTWQPNTNYQDPRTREILKAEFLEEVLRYKDTPGVLMFALGNESNYGLSWSSFEIENLPVGEQNREKARYLYSLFGEAITEAKAIHDGHPYTIVNGDIQYLDLIAEYGQDWDLLGINAYRGKSFEAEADKSLWEDVRRRYGKPVVFMEFGSDAFNAREFREDQLAQAEYLKEQWLEIYRKSYGQGEQGNALGGFVFEWRDEWWKYRQTENLDVHDPTASWENGGYKFDHVPGQNNMNEEWFGIARLGDINGEGIYEAEPRTAYYVLKQIWSLDPYTASSAEIRREFRSMNMDLYAVLGEVNALRSVSRERERISLTGGSIQGEYIIKGRDEEVEESGENGLTFSDGQMLFLDFAFKPTNRLSGDFTINVLGNVADSDFEFRYGDRGLPITVEVIEDDPDVGPVVRSNQDLKGRERVEIYDFRATYRGDNFDVETFYHVPRFHWGYEGDFFGLLRETTDMAGQDIWNAKAPYGIEFAGKGAVDGLKIVMGPEIYWGANPMAMLKYEFSEDSTDYAIMYAEDVARRDDSASATEATNPQTRKMSAYAARNLTPGVKLELGALVAATEKVGETYDRLEGDNVVVDEIEDTDTLGVKAKISFAPAPTLGGYLAMSYAGLVADGGDPIRELGTELPYSGMGNKRELEGGLLFNLAPFTIYPRFLYRENIVDANPLLDPATSGSTLFPGLAPRNLDDDPFAVLSNREARAAEVILTYDPTPSSEFYHWNSDLLEDAPFAFNLGLTYTEYPTDTDSERFFFEESGTNAPFGAGLEAEDVYLVKSRMVFNPSRSNKYILNLATGRQQSTGLPGQESVEYTSVEAKAVFNGRHIIEGYVKNDAFGPYDFYRQFNLTYPRQIKLEYAYLLDALKDEDRSSKYGVRFYHRTLDENSPEEEFEDGANEYMFEMQLFFKYAF